MTKIADGKLEAPNQQNMAQVVTQSEPIPPVPPVTGGSQITLKFGASIAP